MQAKPCHIVGVGSGWGARNMGTADGAKALIEAMPPHFQNFPQTFRYWHENDLCFSNPRPLPLEQAKIHADHIQKVVMDLKEAVKNICLHQNIPLVFGGDHSIAMGTWTGVKEAFPQKEIGLIWVDAHMDAHTPKTSPSLNIHGMPVAALLGYGDDRFTKLGNFYPTLKPENLCLLGTRSFEDGEADFLTRLGVRIYSMEEIRKRGFEVVFQEVCDQLSSTQFGLSIDIDAFDPEEAPGTGTPEDSGLKFEDVKMVWRGLAQNPGFSALEIVEFNPHKDVDHKTCRLVWQIVETIMGEHHD